MTATREDNIDNIPYEDPLKSSTHVNLTRTKLTPIICPWAPRLEGACLALTKSKALRTRGLYHGSYRLSKTLRLPCRRPSPNTLRTSEALRVS